MWTPKLSTIDGDYDDVLLNRIWFKRIFLNIIFPILYSKKLARTKNIKFDFTYFLNVYLL